MPEPDASTLFFLIAAAVTAVASIIAGVTGLNKNSGRAIRLFWVFSFAAWAMASLVLCKTGCPLWLTATPLAPIAIAVCVLFFLKRNRLDP